MGLIFSFCNKSRTQTLEREEQAIIDCKICRDKIKGYMKKLENQEKIKREQAKAELKNNNRDKAKRLLNQSKIFSEQIKVANGQLEMIISQITQIESAQMKKEALKVLEEGNSVLKKLTEEVNIEKWEKISDDMNDVKEQQNEISNFLTSHRIDQSQFDDELNKELAELEKATKQCSVKESDNINTELPSVKKAKENIQEKNEKERVLIEN